MDIMSVAEEGCSTELSEILTRVATSPGQTSYLQSILGGYCHQSRNALNCLKMSLYLARKASACDDQARWNDVDARYLRAERFVERLQALCRPLTLSLVKLPLNLLFDDRKSGWERSLSVFNRRLAIEPPAQPAVGAFDPIRLGEALDELVAWRARVGRAGSVLRARWQVEDGEFHVAWDEPAVECPRREKPPVDTPSAPLCGIEVLVIPLLARIMTVHGGRLDVERSASWKLDLRWPLDAKTTPREAPRC